VYSPTSSFLATLFGETSGRAYLQDILTQLPEGERAGFVLDILAAIERRWHLRGRNATGYAVAPPRAADTS